MSKATRGYSRAAAKNCLPGKCEPKVGERFRGGPHWARAEGPRPSLRLRRAAHFEPLSYPDSEQLRDCMQGVCKDGYSRCMAYLQSSLAHDSRGSPFEAVARRSQAAQLIGDRT